MTKYLIISSLILFNSSQTIAQSVDSYTQGLHYQQQHKFEEALQYFETALKKNSTHKESLIHASRMHAILGETTNQIVSKKNHYELALNYAEKAIYLNQSDNHAHLAHITALGLISEITTSPKEKVNHANVIYQEATEILQRDSSFSYAYFIIGKWHLELSQLSWVELTACKVLFGGFKEEISIEKAQQYFRMALSFNENNILFLYGLAAALKQKNMNKEAIQILQKALSLPLTEPEDPLRKKRCQALLQEVEH